MNAHANKHMVRWPISLDGVAGTVDEARPPLPVECRQRTGPLSLPRYLAPVNCTLSASTQGLGRARPSAVLIIQH